MSENVFFFLCNANIKADETTSPSKIEKYFFIFLELMSQIKLKEQ